MKQGPSVADAESWPETTDPFLMRHLPGTNRGVRQLRNAIAKLNETANLGLIRVVLLTGESGAGKNHVARVLAGHRMWLAAAAGGTGELEAPLAAYTDRFDEISLPNLSDELVESELFGHKKGSFTGADRSRDGLLAAGLDDILLDEIGDASRSVQAKLLRVIETGRFRKLGAGFDETEHTSARLILATCRNLARMVRSGTFRDDLYWRAVVFELRVPPLRDQRDQIPRLIAYQLRELLAPALLGDRPDEGLQAAPSPTDADLAWAKGYAWPGNMRQLRHVLGRWVVLGGHTPFEVIAAAMERALEDPSAAESTPEARSGTLESRLDAALANGTGAAGSLSELVEEATRAARTEIVAWYERCRPTSAQLKCLFPEAKPQSIVAKISQWRRQ